MNQNTMALPKDGLAGLKENWKGDAVSGFLVFLLALPLSLGIAKASDFPPIMGVVTAITGGMVVSFFAGSPITIKGPAAGLIVIVAGAVAEFGGGTEGWQMALGTIVIAGLLQILFGLLKLGKLTTIFSASSVHGMLAAIGIIIISKQVHVLMNIDPVLTKGKTPFELLALIPTSISLLDSRATIIGLVCLAIMLGWSKWKISWLRKIPAPLVVLLFSIPAALFMNFKATQPQYALMQIGNLLDNLAVNVSFNGLSQTGTFIKFVVLFAVVGSLESLLTVKAVDVIDPYRRKSNMNKDLIATGIGNVVAGILGGLPMISEVARSSANVANGAKTRWANFFHGLSLLVFVLLAVPLIELIPNAALAAMLIAVGIRLAHPREFMHTLHIGKEQLLIFVVTILTILAVDLLAGIAAGMLCEVLVNLFNGKPLIAMFKAPTRISVVDGRYMVSISKAAVFSNFMSIKNKLEKIPAGAHICIDLKNARLIDHSVMDNLNHFKLDHEHNGGKVDIVGLDHHRPVSGHKLAARKKVLTQAASLAY